MNRLFRLLPLASLVLTACSLHTPQRQSPDSPQWRQHQQAVRSLNQFQTRGRLPIFPMSKKSMPASSGSKPAGPLSPAADQPAGQHRAVADRAAGQRAADR